MALRPIENALPIATPERLKKQVVKVSLLPTRDKKQQQPESGVTDENDAAAAAFLTSADPTVDYVSSIDLKPLPDPESQIQGLIEGLDSKDWIKVCESLNNARRFALFHSSLLKPNLEKVLEVLVKAVKNPRSALCKTSIMASSDVFTAFGDELLALSTDAFDSLVMQLLLKASQDKRFVCEEADRALTAMVAVMTPLPLLSKLKAYGSHSNLRIRAKAAVFICHSVFKMELGEMEQFGLVPLVQMAADLLNDRLPDAREAARRMVNQIYQAYTANKEQKQEVWEKFCQSNLPPLHAQSLIKLTCSLVPCGGDNTK